MDQVTQRLINRYPQNMTVQVRYIAEDPAICVLEPGITGSTWLLPGVGLVFFLSGMSWAVALPWLVRKQRGSE